MKAHTKVEEIDINKVVVNKWNPNHMTDKIFDQTIKHIRDIGFVGGIIVRKKGKKYEIIDGEHRWRAAQKIGAKKIPVIVLDLSDIEAEMATINFNNLKGEFDNVELAESLHRIKKELGEDKTVDKMGYSQGELKQFDEFVDYDWDEFDHEGSKPNATKGASIDDIELPEDSGGSSKTSDYTSFNAVCRLADKAVLESELDRIKTATNLIGHLSDSRALRIMAVRSAKLKAKVSLEE